MYASFFNIYNVLATETFGKFNSLKVHQVTFIYYTDLNLRFNFCHLPKAQSFIITCIGCHKQSHTLCHRQFHTFGLRPCCTVAGKLFHISPRLLQYRTQSTVDLQVCSPPLLVVRSKDPRNRIFYLCISIQQACESVTILNFRGDYSNKSLDYITFQLKIQIFSIFRSKSVKPGQDRLYPDIIHNSDISLI